MQYACYLILMLLLVGWVLYLFGWYPDIRGKIRKKRMQVNLASLSEPERKRREDLTKLERAVLKLDVMLRLAKKERSFFYKLTGGCFLLGGIAGMLLFGSSHPGLCLMLALGMSPLSVLMLMLLSQGAKRKEETELRNTMSVITNAYISNNDVVASIDKYVQEKRKSGIPSEERDPFERFLVNETYISANLVRDLNLLADEYENRHFKHWVHTLILCQQDSSLKFALKPIIAQLADEQSEKVMQDAVVAKRWQEFGAVVAISFVMIPIFRATEYSWYLTLVDNFLGKCCVGLLVATSLISAVVLAFMQGKD